MRSGKAASAAVSVAALLALAPAALASGGLDSGGSGGGGGTNSGGVNSGGGGGGSAAGSCAKISSLGNSVGYYSVWAAIWSSYSISNGCKGGSISWEMTYRNNSTGAIDFTSGSSTAGKSVSGTVDEDWAAFSTNYTVTLTVRDSSGNVQASQSADTLTPDARTGA